jgi:hypothetical protein
MKKSILFTRYGTYGFMSLILASQMAFVTATKAADTDRVMVDAKKNARSVKRSVKKTGRNLTGQGSTWKDVGDEVKDAGKNLKDEANYAKKKVKKGE